MSIHKLTAGGGYDYLTRQVAAQDATERGHTSLASYYSAKGEAPGTWVGAGVAGLESLAAGDAVTAEQMRNLFGTGRHPLAEQLRLAVAFDGGTEAEQEAAARLGTPFKVYASDVSTFRVEVARRVQDVNRTRGQRLDSPVGLADRARIRTEVATELFRAAHGRDPADARELAATIAKHSRPRTTAVAGYDLTFSPVKSVSALWAIADRTTAAVIERAHQAAVADALAFVERTALFTREGTNGVRQVETRGLVAAAFTHRDSRAGDPDLHTHVAVANKVQTRAEGRWLAIDGRVLFAATVAASETYNTALEHHLTDTLGVRFEPRPGTDPRKRPVREVVGVDPALAQRWSTRRESIEERRGQLASAFQATHGRPPTPVESIQLAQQATLETREAKHEPRSLTEQRAAWAQEAREVLGDDRAVAAMVTRVLHPAPVQVGQVDAAWVHRTATVIRDVVQARRSYWQAWHVRAEALRQVRGTDLPTPEVDRVVDLLVDEVLTTLSVPLTHATDDVEPPKVLRRSDGSSVYTVAGAALFTSPEVLAAEARIVARAGQVDGARATDAAVEVAMAESAAEGLPLNAGQAALVREMATSGARVQLAIAPAGAGKTTAMRALTRAWTTSGGQVIGLAPSAAAATVLGEATGATTDTMAKLLWHLDHGGLPDWAQRIGPRTLVILDEAGMADTLSLDRLVECVSDRGASLRLIGDDQQLAAVGAGGVLRDIRATHGCLHLSELMRFNDPAEGAASLALREGQPEALGFYLGNHRVHVGDLATLVDNVFDAWATDRANGRDAIMLAPTRELVTELNHRARTHRLADQPPEQTVTLADGSVASVGDTVITRRNDRRLHTTATDWVKNGDRWQVAALGSYGALTARHTTTGHTVTLPGTYVSTSVELGYASTIHTAQGVTADVSHTLLTGDESRQLAYTAATRGAAANHLYLQVVDDGDPHNLIRPDHVHPLTATDLLERILARDEAARSATTIRRDADDPATQLGEAAARYLDSLHVAAEQFLGPAQVAQLDAAADEIVPDLTGAGAWPTLRAHLLLLAAHDVDPVHALHTAATVRELDTALDPAAVLDWRIDDTGLRNAGRGPLPWLPGIPQILAEEPQWGPYLAARAARVRDLTAQVAETARAQATIPAWARAGHHRPATDLLVEVAVWRAATQVVDTDRRPTGPPQLSKAFAVWQAQLDARLAHHHGPALDEWAPLLDEHIAGGRTDPFAPVLADRLAAISRAGLDAPAILRRALAEGPLPDDHAAAAVWWRISRHLSPAVATQAASDHHVTSSWAPRLDRLVGADRARELQASPWWPAMLTAVDHALARGNDLPTLLDPYPDPAQDLDACQALVWRISLLNDPAPRPEDRDAPPGPGEACESERLPDDTQRLWAPNDAERADLRPIDDDLDQVPEPDPEPESRAPEIVTAARADEDAFVEADLAIAAARRRYATVLPPTERELETQMNREFDAAHASVSPTRIAQLNRLAADYYASRLPGSWPQGYLTERLGVDLTGDTHVQPGYAPAGWTNLVDHLRRQGATDLELTESGLASTARTGRLIDRFRDRLVLPISRTSVEGQAEVLGFVGRRHPDHDDASAGPKYLNSPDTTLFHKGAQLFAVRGDWLAAGATPVLVEGPLDALAVSLAGRGRYVGLAPLGTALTAEQARELATIARGSGIDPLVATDADYAGRIAARRDYWLLAQHAVVPLAVPLGPGSDPADLLAGSGPGRLREALEAARPLADMLIGECLVRRRDVPALPAAIRVLAADDPSRWGPGIDRIATEFGETDHSVRAELLRAVREWDGDPDTTAKAELGALRAAPSGAASASAGARSSRDADDARTPTHLNEPRSAEPSRLGREVGL